MLQLMPTSLIYNITNFRPRSEERLLGSLVLALERDPSLDHLDSHFEQVIGTLGLRFSLFPCFT
jgi:hypothetical protein